MTSGRSLLISLHPRFAEAIYSGEKKFELRRTQPTGQFKRVFIYETAPVSALTGYFDVACVQRRRKETIWQEAGNVLAITRAEFDAYLQGRESAIIIGVANPTRFERSVSLQDAVGTPEPPQSFRFISPEFSSRLLRLGGMGKGLKTPPPKVLEWQRWETAR